jgi:hypothetical protein
MKKHYYLMCLGILVVMGLAAQNSVKEFQPLQKRTIRITSPERSNISRVVQPLHTDNPMFDFDSLNVSYQGSWGFGQSFSVRSNAGGALEFVGSGSGVIILDITHPDIPEKLSEFSTRGLVDAIYYDESSSRLYVTAYFAGFEIWDVSNIGSPVKIGGGPVTGLPRGGIFANGNYVYVVTVADGVQIFDISNPWSPVLTGTCPLDPNNLAWNSAKSGNLIFAALYDGGMKIVDVSDPHNPVVTGSYSDVVYGVWVANGYAYVVSYNYGLNILNISNPSNITVKGTCSIPGFPARVQVNGNFAYIGNTDSGNGGINVVNVTNPASPTLVATYPGYAENISTGGNTLAFTGSSLPCTILDISVPTAPVFASTWKLPILTSDIYVDGNYAYTGNNGFRVFDISDKTHPVQVGYNTTDGSIVRTAGTKAVFIRESMTSNNPVMVMDITDPANPSLLGQYNSPVMTNDLEVRDNLAYVSCWWDGVRIVNIQDPAAPALVAHTMGWTSGGTPGVTYCYAQAIDVEGNYLYIIDYGPFTAEDTRGLYILDISDPVHPVLVKHFTGFISYGYDLDAVGNFVYIADNYGGVEVIDVTDKSNPVTRGYISLPDGANAIRVAENHAFVADYINGGVQVVDVSNPDQPAIDAYYQRSGCFALGVDVSGTNIYLADGAGGFQIYTTSVLTGVNKEPQSRGMESTSYPNPFTENTVIKVNAGADPDNCLRIYTAAGINITTLFPAECNAGTVVYEWNGKSDAGAAVSPGFYYYRSASGRVSGKVIKGM